MASVPILGRRRERKQAALDAAIQAGVEAEVEKTLTPAVAAAQQQAASGATYPVMRNPSSPFNQVGPGQGFQPLPRPEGLFDSGFGPGFPLLPDAIDPLGRDGRTVPRRAQYLIAANINLVDRRLPWSVLKGLAEDVDVVQRCIQLVQDAIVGLDWSWGFSQQILNQIMVEQKMTNAARANEFAREKYGDELQRVQEFFEYPDKRMGFTFSQWLTDIIYSHLVYDGVVISPQYNLGGELMSLSTIDTPTIKILLDNQGFIPKPPAPAYQQILYGFPRGEYQAEDVDQDGKIPNGYQEDQLAYYIRRPHADSVYGYSQVEECINMATIYMERQAWLHAEYSHGVTPKMVITTPEASEWSPEALGYYQAIYNDQWSGQTQRRQQVMLMRPGMEVEQLKGIDEAYSNAYDEWLVMQIGAKFGIPQSQLGIQMRSSIGGGQAKGQSDQTEMFATDALKNFLIDCINDMARRFLGVGPELTMTATGGGSEDDNVQRAQADASDVGSGIRTRNEVRAERGIPLISEPEADQLGVTSPAGVTFLSGLLDAQEASQDITHNIAAGGQAPGQPAQEPPNGPGTDGAPDVGQQSGNGGTGSDQGSGAKPAGSGSASGSASPKGSSATPKGGKPEPKDDQRQPDTDAEKELAVFNKFVKARVEAGKWGRDFQFTSVDAERAAELNAEARERVVGPDYFGSRLDFTLQKRDDTPGKAADTERLNAYWTEGEGAAKIAWGVDGDFDRCLVEVGKYIDNPEEAKGHCANLHHRATGAWPGHAPGESKSHGHSKKAKAPTGQAKTIALGEDLQERITAYYAPKLAAAFNAKGIDAAIAEAQKDLPTTKKAASDNAGAAATGSSADPSGIAAAAVASNVTFSTQELIQTLSDLYTDAGVAGAGVAAEHIGSVPETSFATMIQSIDWDTWHPGDLPAALKVANGQLKDVLDAVDQTIHGMTDSAMTRLGNALATGLNEGLAPKAIAQQMADIVADPKRAEVISRTETARAQTASGMDSYAANGTEQIQWHHNANACPICVALDEGSPYPIDEVPPYPAHPNERCQLLPYFKDL